MSKFNNGKVVDVSAIPESEYRTAAKEWSEGNIYLEGLLLYCLKNNIKTQACCIGHKDSDWSFIQFEFNKQNIDKIASLIKHYYNTNGINMTFVNQPGVISKFDIRVPKSIGSMFFRDMLSHLKTETEFDYNTLSPDMKSTLDIMLNHKVPNEYLEIQYSVTNNKKELFFATTNYNYSDLYWNNPNAKPWTENSIGIGDTPEGMNYILEDVKSKTNEEYLNYLDMQRGNKAI